MLLKIKAAENDVAAKLIASSSDLEEYVQNPDSSHLLTHGWRDEIFGHDARKMLEGKIGLTIHKNKIRQIEIPD